MLDKIAASDDLDDDTEQELKDAVVKFHDMFKIAEEKGKDEGDPDAKRTQEEIVRPRAGSSKDS